MFFFGNENIGTISNKFGVEKINCFLSLWSLYFLKSNLYHFQKIQEFID